MMKRHRGIRNAAAPQPCQRRHSKGFTLIELIVLIVVFFGSLVGLISVAREAAQRVADTDAATRAMQYAQERAETILADRRNPNRNYAYVALQTATCASVAANCLYPLENPITGTSLARSVQITNASASTLCPVPAAGCKLVDITITRSGRTVASVSFLLANT